MVAEKITVKQGAGNVRNIMYNQMVKENKYENM